MVLSCKPLIADLHTLLRLSVKKLKTPYAKIVSSHLFKTQDPGDHPLSYVTYQSRPREQPHGGYPIIRVTITFNGSLYTRA